MSAGIDAWPKVAYVSRPPPPTVCEVEDDASPSDKLSVFVSEALNNRHPPRV